MGTDGTVGCISKWSGNDEVGVGEQEIKAIFSIIAKPSKEANIILSAIFVVVPKLEIRHQHAKTTAELATIPASPTPIFPHNLLNRKVL